MKRDRHGEPLEYLPLPKGASPEAIMDLLEAAGFIPPNWRAREAEGEADE